MSTESPPPGWYADPNDKAQQRYWTGTEWAPRSQPLPPKVQREDKVDWAAIIVAVLIPFLGFIIGIVAIARGRTRSGTVTLLTSIAAGYFAVAILPELAALRG